MDVLEPIFVAYEKQQPTEKYILDHINDFLVMRLCCFTNHEDVYDFYQKIKAYFDSKYAVQVSLNISIAGSIMSIHSKHMSDMDRETIEYLVKRGYSGKIEVVTRIDSTGVEVDDLKETYRMGLLECQFVGEALWKLIADIKDRSNINLVLVEQRYGACPHWIKNRIYEL